MAHFAKIDETGVVLEVLVIPDCEEHRGQQYLAVDLGLGGIWIQASYNSKIRKNFAGIGYRYDPIKDAFIPPCPGEEWVLDEDTCKWVEQA
jgi:hypothetical protein